MGLGGSPGAGGPLGLGNSMGAAGGMQLPGGSTGTGDGNIGPANVQMPTEPGFAGAPPGMGGAGANKPPQPTGP